MFYYRAYGHMHKLAKNIFQNKKKSIIQFYYFYSRKNKSMDLEDGFNEYYINDRCYNRKISEISSEDLFFGENAVLKCTLSKSEIAEPCRGGSLSTEECWKYFLINARIPDGWKNSGLYATGYILDKSQWGLSSWIWTSAAVARAYIKLGLLDDAIKIANKFLIEQLEDGGWIVRYDFNRNNIIPVIAPNDSAYIANNALLSSYFKTKDKKYLNAAEKCADWIISTSREDGYVYFGYNAGANYWIKDFNIVDTGFTAGLFANLYLATKNEKYASFLKKFIDIYIATFFNSQVHAFSTSVNSEFKQQGGFFSRGQAWALEGLIPAYKVFRTPEIKKIIEDVIDFIIRHQLKNGGWHYNFTKKLMGEDCKGISVIAKSLLDWYEIFPNIKMLKSAQKAILWCKRHTQRSGNCVGGIFSYCIEGAVVHDLYTQTAFVYASAYALEDLEKIKELTNGLSQ